MLQRLKRIYLKNFKCFREHIIHFDETTIMVGQNNAGKTTVVESLRIIGLATARFRSATGFYNRPQWLEAYLPLATKGIKIYAKAIDTDLEQVFYQYSDPPAIIEATFTDNITISVYINSSTELFAVFFHNNVPLYTKKRIQDVGVPDVRVLPQIVPLSKDEQLVARETLQSNKFSKRTSRNFRNNLLLAQNDGNYEKLNQLISETWSRIQIGEIGRNNNTVYLHLRDGDYVTEIYNMGHGIQMWIQMLWFVVESNKDAIIVLDEPDVYLHADLQRKLIRLLQGNFAQVIIATHSIEIMSEVLPENVLIIDRRSAESVMADSYPMVQAAITGMGSIHNIALSRLLNNKKYIFVEGNDISILKIFYDTVFSRQTDPLDHIPTTQTGGWGSWNTEKKQAELLIKANPDIQIYFIYDRDYHSSEEIQERIDDATSRKIKIHIWEKKEIENYLIVSSAIARFICSKEPILESSAVQKSIDEKVCDLCEKMKHDLILSIVDDREKKERHRRQSSTVIKEVEQEIDSFWDDHQRRIDLLSGKDIIRDLSAWSKEVYNVCFSTKQIAGCMNSDEIPMEMQELLSQFHSS